jgi:hypothetical protein
MTKPPGFAHHAKAAKKAHDMGDHATANHHIGKMFGLNRNAQRGTTIESGEPDEPQPDPMGEEAGETPEPRGLGNWMQGAVQHPGALHRQLGIPQGKNIPKGKLAKAEHSSNPLLAKRARLAETFARFRGH